MSYVSDSLRSVCSACKAMQGSKGLRHNRNEGNNDDGEGDGDGDVAGDGGNDGDGIDGRHDVDAICV